MARTDAGRSQASRPGPIAGATVGGSRRSIIASLTLVVTVGLIGLAACGSQAGPRQTLADGIEITAKASKAEYAQLEPVEVVIEYSNHSDALLKVDQNAGDFMALEVTVSRDNRPTPKTCYAGVARVPNPLHKEIKLIPIRDGGRPSRSKIIVNLVRDMTCPGEYTVVIGLPITNRSGTEKSVARSRRIKLSVVARPL